MQGMNGIEAAEAIRERERSRRIPIIFLTGRDKTDEMMFKGYSTGAVDYLVKPIQPQILRAKVEVFVELALAQAQLKTLNLELASKNEALEERTARLQETVGELESYSYSISHDMRAPLRAMRGYIDILLEECSEVLTGPHGDYLARISAGAQRMDRLIQDVLTYSVTARGDFPIEDVDVDKLARDIIDQYPSIRTAQAKITLAAPLPRVRGNVAALTQVISNLLDNAVKFVVPGQPATVRLRAEAADGYVRLWFEDQGIGIAAKDFDRIFGIFNKLHPPGQYDGTGIGLSIVRKAVQRMGGTIGVESEEGRGARFWIRLPAAATAP